MTKVHDPIKKATEVHEISEAAPSNPEAVEKEELDNKTASAQLTEDIEISDLVEQHLKEGKIGELADHLDIVLEGASPDDVKQLHDMFVKHSLANVAQTGVSLPL